MADRCPDRHDRRSVFAIFDQFSLTRRCGIALWPASALAGSQVKLFRYNVVHRTREGRQRTYTIGKHGPPWMPEAARQEARRILGEVV